MAIDSDASFETFVCADAREIEVRYLDDGQQVELSFEGNTEILPRVVSASGAKYSREGLTWWAKGDSALLEQDGSIVRRSCSSRG